MSSPDADGARVSNPKPKQRKRVLITVNPALLEGHRLSTVRSMVSALDKVSDLRVLPISGYHFQSQKVRMYARCDGGSFRFLKTQAPQADLWIVWTDGYYLDHRLFGFQRRSQYLQAQLAFHNQALTNGAIAAMVNSPQAELNTLKGRFAQLDHQTFNLIPTYIASTWAEVHDLLVQHGGLVAKPDWGGGGLGAVRIRNEDDLQSFRARLQQTAGQELLCDYCFQPYLPGDEKRFWIAGGQIVEARVIYGRKTPWSQASPTSQVKRYTPRHKDSLNNYQRDKTAVERLVKEVGLDLGAIDFLGQHINEVNGCGTTFVQYDHWKKEVDARRQLTHYLVSLARN